MSAASTNLPVAGAILSLAPQPIVVIASDGTPLSTITRHTHRPAGGPEVTVVAVAGDLDQDSAPALSATLARALAPKSRVCCDLGAVTFFGAAGTRTIQDACELARGRDAGFTVCGAHGLTREVLEIMGLGGLLGPHV